MPAVYPHVVKAEAYAKDVISGKIPACKWVILACKRHLDDKVKAKSKKYPYRFDREKGERVCDFIEMLPHIKGKWATANNGQPALLHLEGWQCFILVMIFGWVKKSNGKRRFSRANIQVPRKNAKSTIAAGVALYMEVADGEYGAEVYVGATSEKQAFEVYRPAKLMVEKSPDFQAHFGVMAGANAISQLRTNSFIKRLIGKPGDGASPSCSIHDEYHEHPTDEQVDTMRTGMMAREQSLQLIITTAGDNISGPCYMEFEDCKKVLEGVVENDEVFAIIYTIDDDDDWTTELAVRKANPNFGVSVEPDKILAAQREAVQTPRKQAIFKTKHLNVWVGAMNGFFDLQKWKTICADKSLNLDDFHGQECIIALDLATKVDIAALEILFPRPNGEYIRFGKYYLPEETVYAPGKEHYRSWASEGWLTVTDGEIIDFEVIENDIYMLSTLFQVTGVAYDPWQATQLATNLMKEDAPVVEYRHTVQNFSEPMKEVDALIRSGKIKHNGDPVMAWALSNVVAKLDAKDNVYPRKAREENKIDPAVALIMAMGRAILTEEDGPSVYESRGIR